MKKASNEMMSDIPAGDVEISIKTEMQIETMMVL